MRHQITIDLRETITNLATSLTQFRILRFRFQVILYVLFTPFGTVRVISRILPISDEKYNPLKGFYDRRWTLFGGESPAPEFWKKLYIFKKYLVKFSLRNSNDYYCCTLNISRLSSCNWWNWFKIKTLLMRVLSVKMLLFCFSVLCLSKSPWVSINKTPIFLK